MPSSTLNTHAEFIYRWYAQAKQYRAKNFDAHWSRVAKYLRGKHDIRQGADWKGNFVTNWIYQDHMTAVSMLTRDTPSLVYIAREPELVLSKGRDEQGNPIPLTVSDYGKLLTDHSNAILTANEYLARLTKMISDGLPFGYGYQKATWDGSMRSGLGDVRIEAPGTRSIYLQPGISHLRDAMMVFEVRRVDKLTMYSLFPDKMGEVDQLFRKEGDQGDIDPTDEGREVGYGLHTYEHGGATPTTSSPFVDITSRGFGKDKPFVELVEGWFIDERTVVKMREMSEVDPKSGKRVTNKRKVTERMFPTGRRIVFVGSHLLDDRPNPFPAFPYIQYLNMDLPECEDSSNVTAGASMGEYDQLLEINDQYNTRQNQLMDAMNWLASGGFMVYGQGSGWDAEEYQNRPGGMYPVTDPSQIQFKVPPPIPGEAFASLAMLQGNIERVGGRNNILQGEVPGDIRSGFAIEQLSELAQGVMKPRTQQLESTVRSLGRYLIRMQSLFYKQGVHYHGDYNLKLVNPDMFTVAVKAGLNLPASEASRQVYYLQLHDRDVVDKEFLLDNSDIPGKEEVKKRMQEKWEAERQAAVENPQGQGAANRQLSVVSPTGGA